MPSHFSFSRLAATSIAGAAAAAASLLGPRRGQKVRAGLPGALTSVGTTEIGGELIRLAIVDRRCLYWLNEGPASEPETVAWIDRMESGDTLYDVGANIGLFSIYAARKGAVSIAVEPNPFSFAALCRNLLLNKLEGQITPLCLAVGAVSGTARLGMTSLEAGSVGSTLASDHDTRQNLIAMVASLDALSRLPGVPFPQHVKIDVDGIELSVVEGGAALWSDPRLQSVLVETIHCTERDRHEIDHLLTAGGLQKAVAESSETNTVYRRSARPEH